jgi:hypothetical protein
MRILDNVAFWQWCAQVLVVFFVVGGLAGIAVGTGLIVNSSRTLGFFRTINRWTSMRRAVKPLEIPRDSTQVVQRYMRVIAVIFIVGGAYSLYALLVQFSAQAIIFSLKLREVHPLVSGLLIDGIRWILITGNLAAVVVGILMVYSPRKLTALEAVGSKWFSDRRVTQVGDRMHTPLDRWVASAPRAAGVIIAAGSLVVVVSAAFMLAAQR